MPVGCYEGEDHAEIYSKYRPSYPAEIIDYVISYHANNGGSLDNALDIGCGSGQLTNLLADHFKHVIGIDVSAAQINQAKKQNKRANVDFKTGPAEKLPFEDSSVSLITCATAFHWFDQEKFFKEAKRVLVPGGCIALVSYYKNSFIPSVCDTVLDEFVNVLFEGQVPEKMKTIVGGYKSVILPFNNVVRRDDIVMNINMSLAEYMSYLLSWSVYQSYIEKYPETTILKDTEQKFSAALESAKPGSEKEFTAVFKYFLLIGSNDV